MGEKSKASHADQGQTRSDGSLRGGVRRETVVVLVIAAFFLGLVVGAIWAILKTPSHPGPGPTVANIRDTSPPEGFSGLSRDIQVQSELARKDPENPDLWIGLGDLFLRAQLYDKAIEAYSEALTLQPDRVGCLVKLGNAYFDRGTYDEAITAYSRALALDPRNAEVLTDLGVAYRRVNRPEEALDAFRKAADINPMHSSSRYNQGIVLFHDLNDTEGAIRAWQAFLQVEPMGERAEKVKHMLDVLKAMSTGSEPAELEK